MSLPAGNPKYLEIADHLRRDIESHWAIGPSNPINKAFAAARLRYVTILAEDLRSRVAESAAQPPGLANAVMNRSRAFAARDTIGAAVSRARS